MAADRRIKSKEAQPGDLVVYVLNTRLGLSVLSHRKEDGSGWWVVGGGGYGDYVIDDERAEHIIVRRRDLDAVLDIADSAAGVLSHG